MKKISLNDWLQERNQMIISDSFLNKVFPVNDKFIDTQTSKDLLLDEYYKKIDKAITTPGRNTLYYLLHSPLENQQDIKKRVSFLQIIRKNKILSEKIQKSLYRVKFDRFHSIDAIMINEKNFLFNRLQLFTIIFLFILMIIVFLIIFHIHILKGCHHLY